MKEKENKSILNIPFENQKIELNKIKLYANKLLNKKYFLNKTIYGKYIINSIIFEKNNKYVSRFKELLIIDEPAEFFKRYYNSQESLIRLSKYCEFYTKYSKLFPNYIPLIESKYIYKNIHKKQKIIDLQIDKTLLKERQSYILKNNKSKNNKIFNSKIYDSIVENTDNINSAIFGIHNNEKTEKKNNSFNEIENIINSISKYEFEFEKEFQNQNKYKKISKCEKNLKNIIINNYYYNNNSSLTKQSTRTSMIAQQQKYFINEKMFSILNSFILIGLKKKNKHNLKCFSNNSKVYKNLLSYCLIKNNNDKNKNVNNKNKGISEDTQNLINSLKNNKINKSLNNLLNNKNNKSNNNIKSYNLQKNNIQKYTKAIPFTSRAYPSQNKKLIDGLKRLFNFKSKNYQNNIIINKSCFNCSNKKTRKFQRNKLNLSLLNKIFYNKTNYLTGQYSVNTTLKQGSNNTSRNNSDINKKNKFKTNINKKRIIISKKQINKIDISLYNRLYGYNKKYYLNNFTTTNLNFHKNNIISSANFQKSIKNKNQFEKYNAKTERDHIKKVIKIKDFFFHKLNKFQKNQNKNKSIKSINKVILNNNKYHNDNGSITNFLLSKGNTTIDKKFKLNLKNSNIIDKYRIKRNLFKYNNINNTLFLYNNFNSTQSSLGYSNKEDKKNYKQKMSSEERDKNSKKNIDINNQNDTNTSYDFNISTNIKKPSVIKIKGIKIKNLYKVLNLDKSKSYSSKKSERLIEKRKKILLKKSKKSKIKNMELINKNIKKIKNLNKNVKKNNNITNSILNAFPKSLTDRSDSQKKIYFN